MPYDTARMREKLKKMMSGRAADPNEFRPPKVGPGNEVKFRFFVMPPLTEGDPCAGGTASRSMDQCWMPFGQHWVDQKPYACPRVASEGEIECAMCTKGFALMKEAKAKGASREKISAIARQWLPNVANVVNIYFTNSPANPEEYHGRVLYFKLPKACFNEFAACLQREDFGDAESPQAFGAFFDEMAGYLFELKIKNKDSYNNYEASQFLAQCRPMILKPDGVSPDIRRIQEAMDQRHDLYKVCDQPDTETMTKLMKKMWDGDDSDSDEDGSGFTKDEVVESRQSRPTPEPEPAAPVRPRQAPVEQRPPAPSDAEVPAVEASKGNGAPWDGSNGPKVATASKPARPKPSLDDEDEVPVKPVKPKAGKVATVQEEAVATSKKERSGDGPPVDDVELMLQQLDDD